MAKAKKNRINSDSLLRKKSVQSKAPNPFEIQVNNTKFTVLNRDTHSNRISGVSGVHRARAIEKRKQTLGQEFKMKNKTNRFMDQRKEGRNISRNELNAERKSMSSRRKEMYNLNDTVKLTHRGQTLEEIERFDDAVDNDDSDEDAGQLNDEFMKAAHFGGGDEEGGDGKDRKTVIEEMIAESKRKKAEKQRENDEVYEMTQKLDQNWQSLLSVVGGHMKSENERPALEDYDKVMREMIFERRGAPSEKLKSEEELARVEKEKLERLERERLARMNGDSNSTKPTHRSADDLDDGYLLQTVEGDLATAGFEDGTEDMLYDPRKIAEEGIEQQEGDNRSSDDDDDASAQSDSSEETDDLSDLKGGDSENEEVESSLRSSKEQPPSNKKPIGEEPDQAKLSRPKIQAENLRFTYDLPRSYEHLVEVFKDHSPDEIGIILERMLKSNDVKFTRDNKTKCISLFAYLLQYLNDQFTDVDRATLTKAFHIVENVTPHLYDLAKLNPAQTAECFVEVLKEKQEEFHKRGRRYPPISTLVFLKLAPTIYCASDFRHPVVTPALVFMSEILSRCQPKTRSDLTAGMFIATTVLECSEQSKRFLPATLNFLNGILFMCYHKPMVQVAHVIPPFKHCAPWNNLLVIDTNDKDNMPDPCLRAEDFIVDDIDNSFKLRIIHTALSMIKNVWHQLDECCGAHYFASNCLQYLEQLDQTIYPTKIQSLIKEIICAIQSIHGRPLKYLVAPVQKPKPLRLLEPKLEPTYDEIRRRPKTEMTAKEQRKKLQQKVKRVARAAVREIRQDNEFLAKMQFKQRASSDRERKQKVKRIFADATIQQGELNSLDRKAKYKK